MLRFASELEWSRNDNHCRAPSRIMLPASGVVHQVRVTLAESRATRLTETICRQWALSCAEDRSVEPLDMP